MTMPQAEALIDLDAYRQNLEALAPAASGVATMAVVKADGYGHGMAAMARAARDAGTSWLGVATLQEALALRAAGDRGPILCWLSSPGADFGAAVAADIDLTASSVEQLAEIVAAGARRVQLKVDTGLARNGAMGRDWAELVQAARQAQRRSSIEITGVWSHFACADMPDHPANDAQEEMFRTAIAELCAVGIEPRWRHLANSAAAMTRPSSHFDLVRLGIASYGINPDPAMPHKIRLRPVMTLRGRLASVKRVPAGTKVSYGQTYQTDRETTLGLVPMGYGDGIPRSASNRARVGFAGEQVRVAGIICMDQFVIDLGDRPAQRGDWVTLWGPGRDNEPGVQDWANAAGTIGYEIVTRVGGRITRTYRGEL